jgi:broad specificity phosphatase PhoE
MTTLLLVRHGPTPWTGEKRLQGRTDIDLSDSGRVSAAALAPLVEAWRPQTLVASPLSRTLSTAALLTDLTPVVDERWAEAGLGDWEGKRADELGAERPADVTARVEAAVLEAATRPGPVLVVTHGGTIRAVLARFVGLTTDRLEPVGAPSLTVVEVEPDGHARLRHYNLLA